jgi:hypothetical protein
MGTGGKDIKKRNSKKRGKVKKVYTGAEKRQRGHEGMAA